MLKTLTGNDLTSTGFWGQRYQQFRPGMWEWLKPLVRRKRYRMLAELLDQVSLPIANVLELGCAPGDCLMHLHRVRPEHKLHGIDFSEDGVSLAHGRLRQRRIEASLHCGDFRTIELPFKVDLVISFGLIEHFGDSAAIVRHHIRFCVPGGRVVATVPNYSTPVNRRFMQLIDPDNIRAYNLDIMSLDAIRDAFVSAGLTSIRVGAGGGPRIYGGGNPRTLGGRISRRLSPVWNVAACLCPLDFAWNCTLWGSGTVPA